MKSIPIILFVFSLLACHSQKMVVNTGEVIPEKVNNSIINKDNTTIDYNPTYAEFEVDSHHVILCEFETDSSSSYYYKKTEKPPIIDTLSFSNGKLQLGKFPHYRKITAHIPIINTGEYPLIIRYCKSSGGGMLARTQKEPIFPNETAYIEIMFHTRNKLGKSTKTATISANTEQEVHRFTVQWEYVAGE